MTAPGRSSRRGVSVRIFLADGTPDGLRIVEKSNWTGRAVMCSRAQYPNLRGRDEFARPGVYVLLSPASTLQGGQAVYIGQADVARERLDTHLRNREFWTHLIAFSSKDENLNKAHVQYLEARLIELATKAKRVMVENGNAPRLPNLSEADRADAEAFLDDMLVIYPLLGVPAFETIEGGVTSAGPRLRLRGKDCEAEGSDTPEGFIVYKGGVARKQTVPSTHQFVLTLRDQLEEQRVLVAGPNGLILAQDYAFASPSTAAAVFMGRNANGRLEWKDREGRTLKDLQEASLPSTAAQDSEK
jgi:hypothetical protein